MTKKLPVIQSAREVFSGVTRHYFDLLRSAPLASLAYLLGAAVIGYITDTPSDLPRKDANGAMVEALVQQWPLAMAAGLLAAAGFVAAAVRWHRFVLLGERGGPLWGRFEARYLWTLIKLTLCGVLIMSAVMLFFVLSSYLFAFSKEFLSEKVGVTILVGALMAVYVWLFALFLRASIAFPDVALGKGGSLNAALNHTTGNSWRLLGYVLLIQIPLGIGVGLAQMAIAGALGALIGSSAKIITILLMLPISLYVAMIGITTLTVAYRELVGLPQAEPAAEAAFPA
jgi:hypothetical protein